MDLGFSRDVMSQSPFQMSGGTMCKIAIVSILAMNPDIIVVDEPTAGLDPQETTSNEITKVTTNR